MKLLNKIWKEYQDTNNSRKYFREQKEKLRTEREEGARRETVNSKDNKSVRGFGKKLSYNGSTYKYGKPKYQSSLGLVR